MKGLVDSYENIYFKVGDGRRDPFWGNVWCGDILQKDEFLSMYRSLSGGNPTDTGYTRR